ncbi:hypothetical protein FQN51_009579 [Onygenales sp. PD_10]|nr:hypothetical protein FQN51_009579 [Onygenales sp. PD_10]
MQSLQQIYLASDPQITSSIRTKWNTSLDSWKRQLIPTHYERNPNRETIESNKNCNNVLKELNNMETSPDYSSNHLFITKLIPCLKYLGEWFEFFARTLSLTQDSEEMTLIWGVICLGINTVLAKEDPPRTASIASNFKAVVTASERIHASLGRLGTLLKLLELMADEETANSIYNALNDIFVDILDVWGQAASSKYHSSRRDPYPSLTAYVDEKADHIRTVVENVSQIIDDRKKLAELSEMVERQKISRRDTFKEVEHRFPCFELPPRRDHFVGREAQITKMTKYFAGLRNSRAPGALCIYGLGGIGKSSLALHYAWYCRDNQLYDVIFWIHSETPRKMKESYTSIALQLGLTSDMENEEINVLMVKKWLETSKRRWLLIFDNVEEPGQTTKFLPLNSGNVVVTTRYRHVAFSWADPRIILDLQQLDDAQSKALFSAMRGKYKQIDMSIGDSARDSEDAAIAGKYKQIDMSIGDSARDSEDVAIAELLVELQGLPLGIEQSAAYIEADQITVQAFLRIYRTMPRTALKRNHIGVASGHTLDTLWAITFKTIGRSNLDAHRLLAMICMMGAEDIPINVFSNMLLWDAEDVLTEYSEFCEDQELVADAISQLTSTAVIGRAGESLSMHRLTQEAFFCNLSQDEIQTAFSSIVKLINFLFPKSVDARPLVDHWADCKPLIPHAITLAKVFSRASARPRRSRIQTSQELQELMKNCVWYLYERSDFDEALQLLEIAYKTCPDPENSLIYAHLCNSAGVIYYDQNDLKRCKASFEQCLRIREKKLPADDPELATIHSNIGSLMASLGEYDSSLSYLNKSDEARRSNARDTAIADAVFQSTYGWVLLRKGDYGLARARYDLSQELYSDTPGIEVLRAYLVHEYGNLEVALGNNQKAKDYYELGLGLVQELCPWHLLTGTFYYKLAVVQAALGEYNLALENIEKSLEIAKATKLDGVEARILWRRATIIEEDPSSSLKSKVESLKEKATSMKQSVEKKLGLTDMKFFSSVLVDSEEKEYNRLVPSFFQ